MQRVCALSRRCTEVCACTGAQEVRQQQARLEDEAERESERRWHAEDRDRNPAVKEGLYDAWNEQQAYRAASHFLEDLQPAYTSVRRAS